MAYSGYQLLSSYVSSGVFEAACYYSQCLNGTRLSHLPATIDAALTKVAVTGIFVPLVI